jgi:cytochrome P450
MLRNGEEWEKSRKTVQEKLCPNAVANYTPVLLDIADDVLSSRRQEFCISDTHHFLTRYTMKCKY